jgi:thiamine-monophosphate kinase
MPRGEKALIAEIRRMAKTAGRGWSDPARGSARGRLGSAQIAVGIGDDCAVLRPDAGTELLVTTDFSLEGIHFRRDWHPAESVGHRCLARGLSDIAAMGGDPVAAFLSLALPRRMPQSWFRGFMRGLIGLAKRDGVALAGGDTAESPNGILADIVVVGTAPKGKAILRSTAKPGDRIYVSGELGGSAAAIAQFRARSKTKPTPRGCPRHFYPDPRIELGRTLREKEWATAMIDLSDGLSTDLAHICEESGVGAEIDREKVPHARVGGVAREVDVDLVLHGGEDYELLFTARPGTRIPAQIAGVGITCIGRITRGRKIIVRSAGGVRRELAPQGWEHFRS